MSFIINQVFRIDKYLLFELFAKLGIINVTYNLNIYIYIFKYMYTYFFKTGKTSGDDHITNYIEPKNEIHY